VHAPLLGDGLQARWSRGAWKMDTENAGFGLYLHWPFCLTKCPYCDFNSHVDGRVDQRRWQAAFLAELDRMALETRGQVLQSVFFGGGTPSLMEPDLVAAILDKVRRAWPMSNDPEITLEANPTSVEAGRFAAYRQAGVNRVSIGVQALDDGALKQLGRTHSAKEAMRALEIALNTFPRVNFDLIYARQRQSLDAWDDELSQALAMGSRHMSLYQLTIEEGTVFHERNRRGQLAGLPDEDLSADLYLMTQEKCGEAGLPIYEVSNHAVPGEESRHNLTYWRGGDYIGIGPGAHGRLTINGQRVGTEAPKAPAVWLNDVEKQGLGELPRSILTREEAGYEYCLMGLRLVEGISLDRFRAISGRQLSAGRVSGLVESEMLVRDGERLRATRQGMLVLNAILRDILLSDEPDKGAASPIGT
jgi:putative oxygen-independent coproporphyrinogen III oxidase